jgi:hypothetical protein
MSMERPLLTRMHGTQKWREWRDAMIEHDVNMLEQTIGNTTYRVTRYVKQEEVEYDGSGYRFFPNLVPYYIGQVFRGKHLTDEFEIL